MRAILVARKSLLEMLRETQLLGLTIFLPLVFLVIAAVMYNNPLRATYPILIVGDNNLYHSYSRKLQALQYYDGKPIFDLQPVQNRTVAEETIKAEGATLALLFPRSTSDINGSNLEILPVSDQKEYTILGNPLSLRFYRASIILENHLLRFLETDAGQVEGIRVAERSLFEPIPQTEFDLYAPGMIMFALLMIIPQTAMLVTREIRWNTLIRLKLCGLSAWEFFGGISLAQMVIAIIQVCVVLIGARVLGFHSQGSFWLALSIGLIICFSSIGMGLIVACFSENDSQAANVGSTITMFQVFISGAFFHIPPLTLFSVSGHMIDLFDFLPATHGFLALQQVLTFGEGLPSIAFRFSVTLLLSVLYNCLGILLFQRLKMKGNR